MASRVPVNPSRDFSFRLVFVAFYSGRDFADLGTLTLCIAVIPLGRGHSHQCGEEGTRTPDLLLAKQALYQLSYSPEPCAANRVRVLGFEPRTSALSELRSSQLSYTRDTNPMKREGQTVFGLAPTDHPLSGRASCDAASSIRPATAIG